MTTHVPLSPILVADDNPTDVFFLQRGLNTAGIRNPVQHVEDGREAVAVLERTFLRDDPEQPRPALVLVDLKMPRMDGFELLDWMREHALFERTTVAVLSTSDEPKDIERAFRLGVHRFLLKYPKPDELTSLMVLAARRAAENRVFSDGIQSGQS